MSMSGYPLDAGKTTMRPLTQEVLFSVQGLEVGYGDVPVLHDISFDVHKGEVVAIVGANGAGKSTLLSSISGLLPSWKGTMRWKGNDITQAKPERLVKLGMAHVPQGRRLFPGLSVEENLKLGAFTRRAGSSAEVAKDLEKVYALLPKLKERRSQYAGSMSGGEQQMCAIARGLMARPELLLIDELSLGLAPTIVDDLLKAIDDIHKTTGISFIIVEQDVQIALERADRGYVIENGRIVITGKGTELLDSEVVRKAYLGE